MKVLIVTVEYPEMRGGVADHVRHLGRALTAEGVRPVILTSRDGRVRGDGEVEVLPVVPRWSLFETLDTLRRIRKLRPDLVNLQYVPYRYSHYGAPLGLAAMALGIRALGLPLVTTFHEVGTRFQWSRPKYWGIVALQRLIAFTLALSSARIVVAIERYRRVFRRFRRKVHWIPVGSNFLPREVSERERSRLRAAIAPGGETIIATFTGGAWYRPDKVLHAAARLLKSGGRAVKVLVLGGPGKGPPPGGAPLSRIAADLGIRRAVRITGFLEEGEVFRHLAAADLFVLLDEGVHGGVSAKSSLLVAAYAAGLPVVGNRGVQTDSLFADGENISLVDSGDPAKIAHSLERLLDDPEARLRIARGGRRTYEEFFTWKGIGTAYLRAFRRESLQGTGQG